MDHGGSKCSSRCNAVTSWNRTVFVKNLKRQWYEGVLHQRSYMGQLVASELRSCVGYSSVSMSGRTGMGWKKKDSRRTKKTDFEKGFAGKCAATCCALRGEGKTAKERRWKGHHANDRLLFAAATSVRPRGVGVRAQLSQKPDSLHDNTHTTTAARCGSELGPRGILTRWFPVDTNSTLVLHGGVGPNDKRNVATCSVTLR